MGGKVKVIVGIGLNLIKEVIIVIEKVVKLGLGGLL